MSGHSKWKNIMHKKEKTDTQKAKIFTKIGREIAVCVKEGGGDPNSNAKLKDLISKAKLNNVPNDNIDRMIKKAAGSADANNYEAITYEGYGPNGTAIIVETLTDNRNRTAGDLRHYFDKYGGNLGQSGSVSWQFERKGVITFSLEGKDEDALMLAAIEAGADDVDSDADILEVYTKPNDFPAVKEALNKAGFPCDDADVEYIPTNTVALSDPDDIQKMDKLLELLEDNDDVQNVFNNIEE